MAEKLSTAQEARVEALLQRFPALRKQLIDGLRQQGVDVTEFTPVEFSKELTQAAKSFVEGATLGLAEFDREEGLADIDTPLGSFSPAVAAGEVAGIALPGGAALKGARLAKLGKGATRLGRAALEEGVVGGAIEGGFQGSEALHRFARGEEQRAAPEIVAMLALGVGAGLAVSPITARFLRQADEAVQAGRPVTPDQAQAVSAAAQAAGVDPRSQPFQQLMGDIQAKQQRTQGSIERLLPPPAAADSPVDLEALARQPARELRAPLGPRGTVDQAIEGLFGQPAPKLLGPGTTPERLVRDPLAPQVLPPGLNALIPRFDVPRQVSRTWAPFVRQVGTGTPADQVLPQALDALSKLPVDIRIQPQLVTLTGDMLRAVESGALPEADLSRLLVELQVATKQPTASLERFVQRMRKAIPKSETTAPSIPDNPPPIPIPPPRAPAAAAPAAPKGLADELTVQQVLRSAGPLKQSEVEGPGGIIGQMGAPDSRSDAAKVRNLARDDRQQPVGEQGLLIEEALEELTADPTFRAVLDAAGVHDRASLMESIRSGRWLESHPTDPDRAATQAIADRPPPFDPSPEGFRARLATAQSLEQLDAEVVLLDDAFAAGDLTATDLVELTQEMAHRAGEVQQIDLGPRPDAGSEQGIFFPGEQRELPRGPRRATTDRGLEGTGLEEAAVTAREGTQATLPDPTTVPAQIEQKGLAVGDEVIVQTPQGPLQGTLGPVSETGVVVDLADGPQVVVPPDQLQTLFARNAGLTAGVKTGDTVLVQLKAGAPGNAQRIGQLAPPDAPGQVKLLVAGQEVFLSPNDIESVSRVAGFGPGRGGGDAPPITRRQQRQIHAILGKMGRDGQAPQERPSTKTMTREEAARFIHTLERQRTQASAQAQQGLLDEVARAQGGAEPTRAQPQAYPEANYKDVGSLYVTGMVPEESSAGLARNPIGKQLYELGDHTDRATKIRANTNHNAYTQATAGLDKREKYLALKALDGREELLSQARPETRQAAGQLRGLLNQLAQELDLEEGQFISQYLPHIFEGTTGRWRATQAGQELGVRSAQHLARLGGAADVIQNFQVEAGVPMQRFFQHTLQRQGADGYILDLDKIFFAYIQGHARKVEGDRYLDQAGALLKQLPTHDRAGARMEIRRYAADHIAHVSGQPKGGRNLVAKFWRDNQLWNRGVDALVEAVGDAPSKGLLQKARRLGALNDKLARTPGDVTPAERRELATLDTADLFGWLEGLVRDAEKFHAGLPADTPRSKRYRAELALTLDTWRARLADPRQRGILASTLYPWLVMSKLGLNLGHALVNLSQTLTTTYPLLGEKWTARALRDVWLSSWDKPLHGGRTARSLLNESGVLLDAPRGQEFFDLRGGWIGKLQEATMAPARWTEQRNRATALVGQYQKHLSEAGVVPGTRASNAQHGAALEAAQAFTTQTQFAFNPAGTPRILRSPGLRLLLMFQSYPIHMTNFSAELIEKMVKQGDWAPFLRQWLVYGTAAAASIYGGTNLWERTGPPLGDLATLFSGERQWGDQDVVDLFSGPPGAALLELSGGHVGEALGQLEPTLTRRIRRAEDPLSFLVGNLFNRSERPAARQPASRP